jgi:hypothetical protein
LTVSDILRYLAVETEKQNIQLLKLSFGAVKQNRADNADHGIARCEF